MSTQNVTQSVKKYFDLNYIKLAASVLLLLIHSSNATSPNVSDKYSRANDLTNAMSLNSSVNYLMTDPLDVQINVGERGVFDIYLTKAPIQSVHITFRCDGGSCSTFDGDTLQSVTLSPEQLRTSINFTSTFAGHDVIELVFNNSHDISNDYAYVRVRVGRSQFLEILSVIFGWSYFIAWSASFYPQNISNYKRKSVVGLNFDYMILHFTGFIFYAIFNLTLFFSTAVRDEYEGVFKRSEIPVQLNDVVYSIHAAALTCITWIQCLIYESGGHRHSIYSKLLQVAIWVVGAILMVLCIFGLFSWLNFIYYFSYLKLIVTGVKYMPQVIFNFRRKSTKGWSIYMIYLDVTGGTMGLLQMLAIAHNYNDWKTLIGNLPKLGLSLACIFYDIIFLLQEFVFYRNSNNSKRCKKAAESNGNMSNTSGDSQDGLCLASVSLSSSESSSVTANGGAKHVDGKGTTIDLSSKLDHINLKSLKNSA